MGKPITVPEDDGMSDEERYVSAHPESARYNVWINCDLLPVLRMFGLDGQIVMNPLHAFVCLAFIGGKWDMVSCRPGDVTPRLKDRPWLK